MPISSTKSFQIREGDEAAVETSSGEQQVNTESSNKYDATGRANATVPENITQTTIREPNQQETDEDAKSNDDATVPLDSLQHSESIKGQDQRTSVSPNPQPGQQFTPSLEYYGPASGPAGSTSRSDESSKLSPMAKR